MIHLQTYIHAYEFLFVCLRSWHWRGYCKAQKLSGMVSKVLRLHQHSLADNESVHNGIIALATLGVTSHLLVDDFVKLWLSDDPFTESTSLNVNREGQATKIS